MFLFIYFNREIIVSKITLENVTRVSEDEILLSTPMKLTVLEPLCMYGGVCVCVCVCVCSLPYLKCKNHFREEHSTQLRLVFFTIADAIQEMRKYVPK